MNYKKAFIITLLSALILASFTVYAIYATITNGSLTIYKPYKIDLEFNVLDSPFTLGSNGIDVTDSGANTWTSITVYIDNPDTVAHDASVSVSIKDASANQITSGGPTELTISSGTSNNPVSITLSSWGSYIVDNVANIHIEISTPQIYTPP